MNLNPTNQLSLYGHHFEFCNFINLYKNKKLPNKILLSGFYHLMKIILMMKRILELIQKISHLS